MTTLGLITPDSVLASILAEYAQLMTGELSFTHGAAAQSADIIFFTATAKDDLATMHAQAQRIKEENRDAAMVLILEKDVPDNPDNAKFFSGVFTKPLRLGHIMHHALSAWRLSRLRTARMLTDTIKFDVPSRTIENATHSASLTEKEAAFLLAVLDAGAAGLKRASALTQVWGYHPEADSHAVETNLYRLRQKLVPFFGHQEKIISRDGAYCWNT